MNLELRRKPFINTKIGLVILIYIRACYSLCNYGSGPDPCGVEGGVIGLRLGCWLRKKPSNPAARRVMKKSFLYIALFKKERSIWMIMN
ncbi:MAG: hypothetical protein ABIL39_11365 [candidate division WOR-3 bacterium]